MTKKAVLYFAITVLLLGALLAGYTWMKGRSEANALDRAFDRAAAASKTDPVKLREVGHLMDRASNPSKRSGFTEEDVQRLAELAKDPDREIREWAYGALCSLRLSPHRNRAIELIQNMKSDADVKIRNGYFVKAWALNAPDWQAEATKMLENPEARDTARQLLAKGPPKDR